MMAHRTQRIERILAFLAAQSAPVRTREIAKACGLGTVTVHADLRELRAQGRVEWSGPRGRGGFCARLKEDPRDP